MKTKLTPNGAPGPALKPEIQHGIDAVKRVILKTDTKQDIEDVCSLLERIIETALAKRCRLGWADRSEIGQIVLLELLRTLPSDDWLQKLVERNEPDRRLLNGLHRQACARVSSRTMDHLRRLVVRCEEPLEDMIEEEPDKAMPSPEEVCAAMESSPRFDTCYRRDLRFVIDMVTRGLSARKVAEVHSVSPSTVDRAVKRLRPLLRLEFGFDDE